MALSPGYATPYTNALCTDRLMVTAQHKHKTEQLLLLSLLADLRVYGPSEVTLTKTAAAHCRLRSVGTITVVCSR